MARRPGRRCKRSSAWNREWARQHVEAQAESGLSVQDFCFAHGVQVHTFYGWRRRLKAKRPSPSGEDAASRLPLQDLFAEVTVLPPEAVCSESVVEVVVRGGRRLQVGTDFDETELRRLVALLESLPC
jgi:transposase-like protein